MTEPSSELLALAADLAIRETGIVDSILIAEAIWLAATGDGVSQTPPATSESTPPLQPPSRDEKDDPPSPSQTTEPRGSDDQPEPTHDPMAQSEDEVRGSEPSMNREADPVDQPPAVNRRTRRRLRDLPASSRLSDPLESARAFRPFRRTVDTTSGSELDIEGTIRATVDIHHVVPVQRPRRERWHSLHLVVDTSPSMELWRGYAEDLAEAARHSGAFRRVTVEFGLEPIGVTPTKRSIILAVTDATDPSWYDESGWQGLYGCIEQAPTAILNPLPVKLWARTALGSTPARVVPKPGNPPTGRLTALPTSLAASPGRGIPVVELDPSSIDHWAKASTTGTSTLAAVPIPAIRTNPAPSAANQMPPADAVKQFRASASPAAWRLATVASTITATSIDVIRAIQQHLLPNSTAQDLAEFVVSGLLRPRAGDGGGLIEFRQGHREALQTLSDYNMEDVTAGYLAVSSGVVDRFGIAHPEFGALVGDAEHDRHLPVGMSHFVDFAAEALALVQTNSSTPTRGPVQAAPPAEPSDTSLVLEGHYGAVASVAFVESVDGLVVCTAGADGTARLWDADIGEHRTTLRGSAGSISGVDLVALDDGILVATASADGTLQLWDAGDDTEPLGSIAGHLGPAAAVGVATLDDEVLVASAGHDGTVRIWATSEPSTVLDDLGVRLFAVAIAAHGEEAVVAAGGADGVARLWSTAGTELRAFDGHGGRVSDVGLARTSGDRLLVACAHNDHTVRLWDADSGQALHLLEGHRSEVLGVAITATAEGRTFVASSGHDQTVRLWDGDSGQQLHVLEGHTEPVLSVALAVRGEALHVVSGSADGTARLWTLTTTDGENAHAIA